MVKFIKETKFKDAGMGRIPKEWEVVKLTNYVNILKGFAFSSKFFIESEKGLPIIRIRDLGKNTTEAYYSGEYDPMYLVEKGDLLISMDGEFDIYVWKGPRGLLNQRVCKIWSKDTAKLDDMYLYYAMKKPLKLVEAQTSQTTVKHLLDRDLEKIKIPLPPLQEQKAIAKILKDFDDLIEVIEEKIKTLQRIKKKMMDVYFTKGVFEHKEFKDTEIGRIPKEWEVRRLGEVVLRLKAGSTPKTSVKEYYENGNIPFVKIEDLTTNSKYLRKTLLKITEKGLRNSSAWLVPENSLLLAMYGSLGEVSINKIQVATNQAILGIIPDFEKIDLEYLYYWLLYFKPKWNLYAKTTTQANLTKQIVENSLIPLPPLPEQKEIAKRLKSVDDQIENLKEQKNSLEKIKKKFMDLLLSGKVRVKLERDVREVST